MRSTWLKAAYILSTKLSCKVQSNHRQSFQKPSELLFYGANIQTSAPLFPPSGWRCSARWWTPRSTTSFRPSRWCGGSAASSGNPSSSAAQDSPPNTDVFAPAGTTAAARWRCAETVYNDGTGEGQTQRRGGKGTLLGTHRPEQVFNDGAERQLKTVNVG